MFKSLEHKGFYLRAEVAELADAADSKSAGPCAREGSTPSLGTRSSSLQVLKIPHLEVFMKKPMTLAEKLLAARAGLEVVEPGQLVDVPVDLALANDITAPIAIKIFREANIGRLFDRSKIALVLDHFTPNKDIQSAEQVRLCREFAKEQGIIHYFEGGNCGIEHVLLPEQGLVVPGDIVIGADSHTCTYGALGAFATGVGSTDLAATWITGRTWFRVP